ncbi:MAG TPA: YunC family protein [Methanospirillum sp.]|nr:YunC family protein [Methanospirillum sp.]
MTETSFELDGTLMEGHIIPIGSVNLVFAKSTKGLVGCGAIDVLALEKFSIPAAKVKPVGTASVSNIDELLSGEVVVSNQFASDAGVTVGMTGRDALITLS